MFMSALLHAPTLSCPSPSSSKLKNRFLMASSVRIAVVGDVQDDWNLEEDTKGSSVIADLFSSSSYVFLEKAGFLGVAITAVSFFSIEETSNMDGLSSGFSWTHNRATCMHLISLHDECVSSSDGSINSICFPSFHNSYA
ncbi:hypothetical protein F0562_030303 [Nyssa sinensis]|uniref:Uncharacterized protein n=1 Tax=Nyssa sinensis TaxID=561372 RepID=A0A5J5AYD5_9ASTE|nr:hypothetical protein F0562_030303 [Nyssa sinensis]